MRILVFDTETTGLPHTKIIDPNTLELWPHIVQLSYAIYDTETAEIVGVLKNSIVKMKKDVIISDVVAKIHGITNEISNKKGIDIKYVLHDFFNALDKLNIDILIAHNLEFDMNMVKIELMRIIWHEPANVIYGKKMYKLALHKLTNFKNTYCTMKSSTDLCNITRYKINGCRYTKFPRLSELHKTLFNTDPDPKCLHNALIDVLITLRCYIKLKDDVDIHNVCEDFKELSTRFNIY